MSQLFNLEEEYGGFLDLLESYISEIDDESLKHFGVKGMKWGVRKDRSSNREPLRSLGPDKVVRKTKSGETITIEKVPPNKLHNFLGRISKNYREDYAKQAMLNILDGSGKKVGDAMVQKKNNEELYLEWLGIKKSARGNGYATAVMKAARDFGKQAGFKRMVLEVPGNSPDARHIYEKLGFKFVSDVDGGSNDPIWGGLSNMVYEFDAKHEEEGPGVVVTTYLDKPSTPGELVHFGVKGMHWGVRKKKPELAPHGSISKRQHTYNRNGYGKRGARDINKKLHEGKDLQTARNEVVRERKKRFKRNVRIALAAYVAVRVAPLILGSANAKLSNIAANKMAANGAKAAQNLFADSRGISNVGVKVVEATFDSATGIWG